MIHQTFQKRIGPGSPENLLTALQKQYSVFGSKHDRSTSQFLYVGNIGMMSLPVFAQTFVYPTLAVSGLVPSAPLAEHKFGELYRHKTLGQQLSLVQRKGPRFNSLFLTNSASIFEYFRGQRHSFVAEHICKDLGERGLNLERRTSGETALSTRQGLPAQATSVSVLTQHLY